MRWTGRKVGALVFHDGRARALPSRDVSETFVAGMLSMMSPEAECRMMEEALAHQDARNTVAPPVWSGTDGDAPRKSAARVDYTPEGF